MIKKYVLGDLHGRSEALKQVLERSGFDKENDKLILIGDICDGGPNTKECVDILLTIKDLVFVYGNHDHPWMTNYVKHGHTPYIWIGQGGAVTLERYGGVADDKDLMVAEWSGVDIPEEHKKFWESGKDWHHEDNKLFVHGGFNPLGEVSFQDVSTLTWDRNMAYNVRGLRGYKYDKYNTVSRWDRIFIGHTYIGETPVTSSRITAIDTGAGGSGFLTIMDIETLDYWQSDKTGPTLRKR